MRQNLILNYVSVNATTIVTLPRKFSAKPFATEPDTELRLCQCNYHSYAADAAAQDFRQSLSRQSLILNSVCVNATTYAADAAAQNFGQNLLQRRLILNCVCVDATTTAMLPQSYSVVAMRHIRPNCLQGLVSWAKIPQCS